MKIALVMPDDFSLWQPRRGLIKGLVARGFEVYGISTPGEYVEHIEGLGAIHIPVAMDRHLNPGRDVGYLLSLVRIFRAHRFYVVHNLTTKPNIYGAIAGRLAGVGRVVGSVEGLGHAFAGGSDLKSQILRFLVTQLYRLACGLSYKMRFMNSDDLAYFVSHKMIRLDKAVLIVGEGVNLDEYSPELVDPGCVQALRAKLGGNKMTRFVTMVARANWNKGVREFVEASEMVGKKHESVKFLLAGTIDEGPAAVPREYLEEKKSHHFQWLGFVQDLREVFLLSDMVVLPSYAREGVPNSLIEAMAMGKPIVTTDNVGCREVVEEGRNGYLVPVRDAHALAGAIGDLLCDEEKRQRFGRHSRVKVEAEFDERLVVDKVLKLLYGLDGDA